jgi:diguanylate cyclase (GGDEF)-like protein
MLNNIGVQGRFFSMVLPVSGFIFILLISIFEWRNFTSAEKALKEKLHNVTNIYSLFLAEPIANKQIETVRLFTSYLLSDPDITGILITDNQNNILDKFESKHLNFETKTVSINYSTETSFKKLGKLKVSVSKDRIIDEFKQRVIYEISLLGALIIAMLISIKIAYRYSIGIPLRNLTCAIVKYDQEGEHEPVPYSGNDELSTVIETYNRMQQIQQDVNSKLQSYHVHLENEVRERTSELEYHANHDPLTKLINRRKFNQILHEASIKIERDGLKFAIFYIDLDQFKLVNDSCGHTAGDQLLVEVSNLLKQQLRPKDCIARLGGDEFAVLINQCTQEHAVIIAEKMLKVVEDYRFISKSKTLRIGLSIGVVMMDSNNNNVDELMRQADLSCYVAKDNGRNCIHLHHSRSNEIDVKRDEMRRTVDIQQALDKGYFELWCQPIERLTNGNQHSWCEILIRMRMPDNTVYLPGTFLPSADRYGLAIKIDRWVVESVVTMLAMNKNSIPYEYSAINLSVHTISDDEFLEFCLNLFRNKNVDPSVLCFEITETAAISNLPAAKRLISGLKAVGCKFSLDDFGTGVSSFAYLRSLDVDYLKIDGVFISNLDKDPINQEIVRSIHEIGKLLGKQTIAEFVDSDNTMDILREIGVNYGQGYHIRKPFPICRALNQ